MTAGQSGFTDYGMLRRRSVMPLCGRLGFRKSGAAVARKSHKLQVGGSNPSSDPSNQSKEPGEGSEELGGTAIRDKKGPGEI